VLRKLAEAETNTRVAPWPLAVALSGANQKNATEPAGMDWQTLWDWVICYDGRGFVIDGATGRRPGLRRMSRPG
jgi:hypothetical protein